MTFVVLTCTECGHRTILDEIDGSGFCMYCGSILDCTFAEPVDQYSESFLQAILDEPVGEQPSYVDEPWYPELESSLEALRNNDMDGACINFSRALNGKEPEIRRAMQDAMAEAVAVSVIGPIFEGTPYGGGVIAIAPLLVCEGDDDTLPSVLIASLYRAICDSKDCINTAEMGYNIAASAYTLLVEYFLTETSITDLMSILEDYSEQVAEFVNILISCENPDSVLKNIGSFDGSAACLLQSIKDAIEGIDEDVIAGIEARWAEKGAGDIGEMAGEILTRVFDESFNDSDSFWDIMEKDSRAYAEAYLGLRS